MANMGDGKAFSGWLSSDDETLQVAQAAALGHQTAVQYFDYICKRGSADPT